MSVLFAAGGRRTIYEFCYNSLVNLVLLIGIPGSGKSTYARSLRKPTICLDDIRQRLYGDASILGKSSEVDREVRRQLQQFAEAGQDVVLDATHVSSNRRRRTARLGRRLGYDTVVGVWFKTPLEECLKRNRRRERRVPEFVLYRMQYYLDRQPPMLDEGFDAIKQMRPRPRRRARI